MKLAGELEASASQAQFRFGATWAYYQIVRARITDLKETPVEGLQTLCDTVPTRVPQGFQCSRSWLASQFR